MARGNEYSGGIGRQLLSGLADLARELPKIADGRREDAAQRRALRADSTWAPIALATTSYLDGTTTIDNYETQIRALPAPSDRYGRMVLGDITRFVNQFRSGEWSEAELRRALRQNATI